MSSDGELGSNPLFRISVSHPAVFLTLHAGVDYTY